MKTTAAQITFRQESKFEKRTGTWGHTWVGSLLNREEAIDTQDPTNRPAKMRCWIWSDQPNAAPEVEATAYHGTPESVGYFHLLTQGASKGGRRYRAFRTLTQAQEAAIRWAGRRFRVPLP